MRAMIGCQAEAFAALGQPIRVNARPFERFDQLVLWAAAVERDPERPLGRATVVFPAVSLRPEDPSAPRPGGEPRIERAHRTLELADDERDLKGRKPIERRDHGRESTRQPRLGRDDFGPVATSLRSEVKRWEQ